MPTAKIEVKIQWWGDHCNVDDDSCPMLDYQFLSCRAFLDADNFWTELTELGENFCRCQACIDYTKGVK